MQRFEYFTENDVQKIHEASMHVLETVGVDFGYAPAVEVFKKAGCKVDGERVFLSPKMVMEQVSNQQPPQAVSHEMQDLPIDGLQEPGKLSCALSRIRPGCPIGKTVRREPATRQALLEQNHGRRPQEQTRNEHHRLRVADHQLRTAIAIQVI